MLFNYLKSLKNSTNDKDFKEILKITERDIKVNRTDFGKVTSPQHFIYVCEATRKLLNV